MIVETYFKYEIGAAYALPPFVNEVMNRRVFVVAPKCKLKKIYKYNTKIGYGEVEINNFDETVVVEVTDSDFRGMIGADYMFFDGQSFTEPALIVERLRCDYTVKNDEQVELKIVGNEPCMVAPKSSLVPMSEPMMLSRWPVKRIKWLDEVF